MMRTALFLLLLLTGSVSAQKRAQKPTEPKKPLTHEVYDHWKEIPYKALTPDGNWLVYLLNPQDGDGKAVFRHVISGFEDSVHRAADVKLTHDSRYAVFKIKPPQETLKELRRNKKKKEDLPKDSLGLFSFENRSLIKIPDVRGFKTPEKAGQWLAYQLEARKEPPSKEAKKDSIKTEKQAKKSRKNSDENGYTLIVKKYPEGKEVRFPFVKEYTFAKYGQGLVFTTTGNDSLLQAGVYWYDLAEEKLQPLLQGKARQKFRSISISETGDRVAFIVDADTTKALYRFPKLYYWQKGEDPAMVLADENTPGLPTAWIINEHYTPVFSKDGSKLFFGTQPQPLAQDTLLLPEEIVNVEVWNWQDDYIYPQQNKQLDAEKKRAYLAVMHLHNKSMVPLGSTEIPQIELGDEGNASLVLGRSDVPYRVATNWDISGFEDVFILDVNTGSRKNVLSRLKGNASLSPRAAFVYWFSLTDTAWFSYSLKNNTLHRLGQQVKVQFADEEDDHPDFPSSYGLAGWTADDKNILVYDRYDIWSLDPENKQEPVNLTRIGREQKIVFRYIKTDPEARFIDPEKEMLLSCFFESTKASGYYKLSLRDGKLTPLLVSDHRYTGLSKALLSDRIVYTRENFTAFPDVWVADMNLKNPKKVTSANPQMANYRWGSVETVQWTSLDNIHLKGLLYKPEGFDASKKYPMIVYFYEKNSDNLHHHVAPAPIRASVNFAYYVSNGYLVFVPDIVYKIGYPGESALNCILPGVTSLMAKGFVDEKHIGIQGHSWGGYQTAYLITRSNLFAAAEAGAPVSNMTSAYGGIRWESGRSRMFQYEKSQSRIGATLWEAPVRYIENSPLFFADKIETPLLMMHNDGDGAVPWYQGIEFFMALRRLQKPVWMLNYNNQGHGLTQRQDKTDFAIRMSQFFDHFLKGKPMPEWMKKGIPAVEKGVNNGYLAN